MEIRLSLVACVLLQVQLLCAAVPTVHAAEEKTRQEEMLVLGSREVHVASIRNKTVEVRRISPEGKIVDQLVVNTFGKIVWTIEGQRTDSERLFSHGAFQVSFVGAERRPRLLLRGYDMALSPDGSTLAYVGYGKAGKSLSLYCEDLNTGNIRQVSTGWRFLASPAWSPDGKKIAYYCTSAPKSAEVGGFCEGGVCLNVVDVVTGRDKQVAPPSKPTRWRGEERTQPMWSPASDRLFFEAHYQDKDAGVLGNSYLYQVPVDGEQKPFLLMEDRGYCSSVSARDGTLYVVAVDIDGDECIYALVLDGDGKPRKKTLLVKNGSMPKISPSGTNLAYIGEGLRVRSLTDGVDMVVHKTWHHTSSSRFYWVSVERPRGSPDGDAGKEEHYK